MPKFTVVKAEDIWRYFSKQIFKGGGNQTEPKMVRSAGLRPFDFDIRKNPETGVDTVYPNPEKGLSFSTTVERLARLGIEGVVWEFPEGAKLPPELLINLEDDDHPLINVVRPTPVPLVITLLNQVGAQMKKTSMKIINGKVVSS